MTEVKRKILKGAISRIYLLPKLIIRDILKSDRKVYSNQFHLKKAINWLIHAQKATIDGGVSSSYSLLLGWGSSYPETSGYIIPTLLDYYHLSNDNTYLEVSKEIADWECSIQMENGGFQGDVISKQKRTTVFNTGQIILGLIRAYKELKVQRYLNCAIKAGDFLINIQDKNGNWTKFCFNNIPHTYNVRVAWALLELFQIIKKEEYKQAAINNLNWAITQKNQNYWFQNNAFKTNEYPLLHTIAYTLSGFLESGIILDDQDYKDVVLNAAIKLLLHYKKRGSLPARFDHNWESNDYYSCLTGVAQLSIIWLQLSQIYKKNEFLKNAIRLNNYLKSIQTLNNRFKEIDGAIKGSDPIWGKYNPFSFPNWGTKFFCDALMLEQKIRSNDL